jgi:hypothetical protein
MQIYRIHLVFKIPTRLAAHATHGFLLFMAFFAGDDDTASISQQEKGRVWVLKKYCGRYLIRRPFPLAV